MQIPEPGWLSRAVSIRSRICCNKQWMDLPAIDIGWWNVGAGKVETAQLDAMSYQVVAHPGHARDNFRRSPRAMELVRRSRRYCRALAAGSADCNRICRDRLVAPVTAKIDHDSVSAAAEDLYLQSEAWSFRRLRRVSSQTGDARTVYFAMLDWLQRFEPVALDGTIKAFKAAAADPMLDFRNQMIEQQLFASHRNAGEWSSRRLLWRVGAAPQLTQAGGQWRKWAVTSAHQSDQDYAGSVNRELAQAGQMIGALTISQARTQAFFTQSSCRFKRSGVSTKDGKKRIKVMLLALTRQPSIAAPCCLALVVVAAALTSEAMAQAQRTKQASPSNGPAGGKKPNILVIMGDDIGWFNISAYNMDVMGYRTPNIDRIAQGRRPFYRLVRAAELHRRPRRLHHRPDAGPHRPHQGRSAGRGTWSQAG